MECELSTIKPVKHELFTDLSHLSTGLVGHFLLNKYANMQFT